jgi:hypothetical protein
MSTVKFGSKPGAPTPSEEVASVGNGGLTREGGDTAETVTEESQSPAIQGDQSIALPSDEAGGFSGSWSRKDVRLPRINLIHKTSDGDMIEKFGIGSFALDKTVKLSNGKTPFVVGVVRAARDLQQKLPYGDPNTPNVVADEAEVLKIGGSLNYKDAQSGNFYGPRAHLQLVFQAPENLQSDEELSLFPYEFNGKPYAMAMLTVASSAYTSVGKELATLCNNNRVMRKGMEFGKLELTSETRKKGDLDWKIPVIKFVGENPAELVAFYRSLL